MIDVQTLQSSSSRNNKFYALLAIGVLAMIVSLLKMPTHAWVMMLAGNFYIFCLGVFGTIFLGISYVVQASYVVPFRRVWEALAATVPYTGILMLTILAGSAHLYEWTDAYKLANDTLIQGKAVYLNLPFFTLRMVLVVALFSYISHYFVSQSRRQDQCSSEEAENIELKLKSFAGPALVLMALGLSVATFDWIMSVHSHWYSTIYMILVFAGLTAFGFAFTIMVVSYLHSKGIMTKEINENHLHDLGKMLFAFCVFWMYIWYSQFLLIWYANIPEAAEYFYIRFKDGWTVPFWATVFTNWLIPFLVLLPRGSKRNKKIILPVCVLVMLGHLLNLYVMIAPKIFKNIKAPGPHFGVEWLIPAAYFGLFLIVFFRALQRAPLLPAKSPYLAEGLALHQ